MNAKRNILPVVLLSLVWLSCETEVDTFSEPKETAVVFALLSQTDTVQYFRINPTFIGSGDANDLAGDPDVINYREGEIEVALVDMETDQVYKAVETDKIKLKEEGIFDPNIRMYKLLTPVDTSFFGEIENQVIAADHTYQLLIRHVPSGKIFTATTTVGDINDLELTNPNEARRTNATSSIKYYGADQYSEFQFKFIGVPGAVKYLLEMNYYYTEAGDDSLSKAKYVRMKIGEVTSLNNEESFVIKYKGEQFYRTLQQSLPPNTAGTQRIGRAIDLYLTVFGKEISTYIDVQNASQTGISQERPTYTNISDGLGIFSYATTYTFQNLFLNQASADQLLDGSYTQELFDCAVHFSQSYPSTGFLTCR